MNLRELSYPMGQISKICTQWDATLLRNIRLASSYSMKRLSKELNPMRRWNVMKCSYPIPREF